MKVLAVHTYPGANETVKRHFPYYLKAGADRTIGITTTDGDCYWPTDDVLKIGKSAYIGGPELSERLVRTLEVCLALGASEITVIEYDVLMFKPLPPLPGDGIAMVPTGGGSPGYLSTNFFHVPWYMNAATARIAVDEGNRLLAAGQFEQGSPDRFIGLIVDRTGLKVYNDLFWRYTRNTVRSPEELQEARTAYRAGFHAIHGIKTAAQLDFIVQPD